MICQLCDKPGHTAAKCWHRFEQNYAPPQPQFRGGAPNQQQGSFNPSAHLVQTAAARPPPSLNFGFDSSLQLVGIQIQEPLIMSLEI